MYNYQAWAFPAPLLSPRLLPPSAPLSPRSKKPGSRSLRVSNGITALEKQEGRNSCWERNGSVFSAEEKPEKEKKSHTCLRIIENGTTSMVRSVIRGERPAWVRAEYRKAPATPAPPVPEPHPPSTSLGNQRYSNLSGFVFPSSTGL